MVARACKATRVRGAGRCRVGLAGGLVGAVLTAVTGCGVQPGSGLCTETQLELADVSATTATTPLELAARLTVDGGPLVGAEVTFFVTRRKSHGEVLGVRVGSAETNADGWATLSVSGGPHDLPAFSGERVEGYSARFQPISKIDGVQYCHTKAEADLTVPCAGFGCRAVSDAEP